MRILVAILLLLPLACQRADQRPQAIESHDVCAHCKMAISQARYAAQIVDLDATAFKFDDIGCMLSFARARKLTPAGGAKFYAMDYVGSDWLSAEEAVFIRSEAVDAPMASGLVAFRDRAAAQNYLKGKSGQILNFKDLLAGEAIPMQHAR